MIEKTPARSLNYCSIIVISLALLCITGVVNAQRKPLKDISASMETEYPQLKESASTNFKIPAEFEKQILYALSYFPELKNAKITFKLKKGGDGIIATRPSWGGIFRRAAKRRYIVIINDTAKDGSTRLPLWRNGTVNGQVGIVGHELCHILYFNKRNGFGLIGLGIRHISKKYMDNFENKTDSVDIERGLGFQLIDWNIYLRKAFGMKNPEGPDPFTGTVKRERYMRPSSIRRVMKTGVP
ncbi:MAG: hypothetical protein EOO02_11390, partial [Chitinophagaceae bacterium]